MIAHLEALRDRLVAEAPYPVHLFRAGTDPGVVPSTPYLVLGVGQFGRPDEMPVCDESGSFAADVRLTAVGLTGDSPPKILDRVRSVLSPMSGWTGVTVPGRSHGQVKYVRTEVASAVDRDMTVTNTNQHPSWGVDTYSITSEPT